MDDSRVGIFEVPRIKNVPADDAEIGDAEVREVPLREYWIHDKRFPEKLAPALELMRELLHEARGPEADAEGEMNWDDWTFDHLL